MKGPCIASPLQTSYPLIYSVDLVVNPKNVSSTDDANDVSEQLEVPEGYTNKVLSLVSIHLLGQPSTLSPKTFSVVGHSVQEC